MFEQFRREPKRLMNIIDHQRRVGAKNGLHIVPSGKVIYDALRRYARSLKHGLSTAYVGLDNNLSHASNLTAGI